MTTLRDYQQSAVDTAISWHKYKESPCIINIATGGGKSHVIAALAEYYYGLGKRVAIIAHRKQLLAQNGGKLSIPHGYCSASLGDSNLNESVIVGGIQTIVNRDFQKFDVILIDECHRVPNNDEHGQYWKFINNNDGCLIVGLTATPYRLSGGKLSWGEIVYEATYPMLLKVGHLSRITNKVKATLDLSGIKVTKGEYDDEALSSYMESPELIDSAVKNIIAYGNDRKSIIIFCVSVDHANILCHVMEKNGLSAAVITGSTDEKERDKIIDDFRSGALKHLVNCEILLEGFDAPGIDMVVCLRPTKSKALWEQMLGRGVRKAADKDNCLLIDMANNLYEHGGLGEPYKEKGKNGSIKTNGKVCPNCEEFCEPNATDCSECGYKFIKEAPSKINHEYLPDFDSGMEANTLATYRVFGVSYSEHISRAKGSRSIKVSYNCPYAKYGSIDEYLSPWHENDWVRGKAHKWFKERGKDIYGDIGKYDAGALLFFTAQLKMPKSITVDHSEKFPRIKMYEWEESRSSDTEGASEMATDLLAGDEILF